LRVVALGLVLRYRCGVSETGLVAPPTPAPVQNWREGITAKEAAFVEHYAEWRNATQAYTHAYDTHGNYETRRNEGARLFKKPAIQRAIGIRARLAQERSAVDVSWLLNRFLKIANADPRELIGLKVGCCRFCYGVDHLYQWREREYLEALEKVEHEARVYPERAKDLKLPDPAGGLDFNATYPPLPNCPQCHGEGVERFVPRDTDTLSDEALLLYGGVKVKSDGGYEIIMADRGKALELAGRILGAFNDKLKVSGMVGHMHAIADLRAVDPQQAAAAYRDFVGAQLAA
jgi:phage terminase small subunit